MKIIFQGNPMAQVSASSAAYTIRVPRRHFDQLQAKSSLTGMTLRQLTKLAIKEMLEGGSADNPKIEKAA